MRPMDIFDLLSKNICILCSFELFRSLKNLSSITTQIVVEKWLTIMRKNTSIPVLFTIRNIRLPIEENLTN